MSRWVAFVLLAAVATLTLAADKPVAKKPSADEVRKQFYQCWLEIEETVAGVTTTDPEKLVGREFTLEHRSGWPRRTTGERSRIASDPSPRIDPTADPMRVDFFNRVRTPESAKNRDAFIIREDEIMTIVNPGIFKFEDGNLIIAKGDTWVAEKKLGKGEDYPGRPTDFTSTKENKRTVTTLKPSNFWDED